MQVLKGPQSLFFGKNSPAGVVVFESNDPTSTFEGLVRGGYEFRADEYFVDGYVSGPLTDTLGARLALRYTDMKGYFKNQARSLPNPFADNGLAPTYPGAVGNRRTPDASTLGARFTLEFEPTDDFSANLKLLYNRYRDNEATGYLQTVFCTGGGSDDGGMIDPFDNCKPDKFRSVGILPPQLSVGLPVIEDGGYGSKSDMYLASLGLNKEFGGVTLSSQTAYFDADIDSIGCYSYTVFCRFSGVNGEMTQHFQQEIRLRTEFSSPFNFMAGGYYETYERDNFTYLPNLAATLPVIPDSTNGNTYVSQIFSTTKGKTSSVFGQVIFSATSNIELTLGGRFTHETRDGLVRNVYRNESNPFARALVAPVGAFLRPRFSDNDFSPEATATWRITPRQTLYAAYRTGYKSGGFSIGGNLLASTVQAGPSALEFGSEKAKGAELGYKAELLDRRLTLNAGIYHYRFTGLQRAALDVATLNFVVRNAASAVTKGAEVDVAYLPVEGLRLHASAGYNRARYKKYDTAPCYTPSAPGCVTLANGRQVLDLSGEPLSRAPDWVVAGGFSYERPITSGMEIGFAADGRYSDEYITQEDGNPNGIQRSYAKLNASITLREAARRWEVVLSARNLTNKYVVLYSAGKPGSLAVPGIGPDIQGFVDRPRELAIQTTFRF